MPLQLSAIAIHPLKSCAPLALDEAVVEPRGLAHDRRWMVVDAEGRFLTGRQLPALVRIAARPADDGLVLSAPGLPHLAVAPPAPDAPRMPVVVWRDTVDAARVAPGADAWLSSALGRPVRLVHMDDAARRPVSPQYAAPGDEVSFADGFPLLLVGQSSLDALNARLPAPVPMARFRPNLVVKGAAPHVEDGWRRIRIGGIAFDLAKPCTRCVFTTVDPENGAFDPSGEPLQTLKHYRRTASGVTFGVNLIARGTGTLRVGDAVEATA
ncbi:MAG: MOSC domain-containing protein [Pseudomonadota bacterium]|jgi:uncharacterized protein YcbX